MMSNGHTIRCTCQFNLNFSCGQTAMSHRIAIIYACSTPARDKTRQILYDFFMCCDTPLPERTMVHRTSHTSFARHFEHFYDSILWNYRISWTVTCRREWTFMPVFMQLMHFPATNPLEWSTTTLGIKHTSRKQNNRGKTHNWILNFGTFISNLLFASTSHKHIEFQTSSLLKCTI